MTVTDLAVSIAIELIHPDAQMPRYANPTDGGMDVICPETVVIPAGKTVRVPTGLKVAVPEGWMLLVFPRSGMSLKTGLRVANSPGLIDAGYRDEVGILLHNTAGEDYTIEAGSRIAQFVLVRRTEIRFEVVESVKEIGMYRGGGFGSSGA